MGSFKRSGAFDPFDMEIIEQAYDTAWAAIVSREPFRDTSQDNERKMFLRKRIFAIVCKRDETTDLATLANKALASMPEFWIPPVKTKRPPRRNRVTP